MKPHALMILFLSAAAFAVGCKPSEEKTAAANCEAIAQQIDKVTKQAKETTQDMKDYAYTQQGEFVGKMQSQLTKINRDLEKLSGRVESANDAAQAEAKPQLETLCVQVAELNKQLNEAKNATEFTWDKVKDGFNLARQWVSDKIEP
jgi:hypothetical protein